MLRKLRAYWHLGILNLIWVVGYRLALKSGFIENVTKIGGPVKGPFFLDTKPGIDGSLDSLNLKIFSWIDYSKNNSPNWHQSTFSKKIIDDKVKSLHWSKISDFNLTVGDIKAVWDLSRFDWLLYFSIEFLKTGDESYLESLNGWLEDWSFHNPVNQGVNWKCGQETSIRMMHLCLTSYLLKPHTKLTPSVIKLLEQHLSRISSTLLYAMAQDNNHGSSEAVALYIGGLLLEKNTNKPQASKWKKQGRYWIENRVRRLIAKDGSFSQHSVNYHRVMLDSLCLAEFFRLQFSEPPFSQKVLTKIRLAIDWLNIFTDSTNGAAPNIGANDGAMLIPLSMCDYRDYRPTVQLASVLFYNKRCYSEEGKFNQPLKLLSLDVKGILPAKESSKDFTEGGYLYIKKGDARLFLRYPKFQFRPSQCDVLHVDFWLKGKNIFRDAGSYSYNTDKRWLDYFTGTEAHNTIQFDDREQMPRLSRFLFGDWLKVKDCSGLYNRNGAICFMVAYKSENAFEHNRKVCLSDSSLMIEDSIGGFKKNAVLRWRLIPGKYELHGSTIISDNFEITISSDVKIKRIELIEGWESLYYMKKTNLPVLEIEVLESAKIETIIKWTYGNSEMI